MPYSLLSRAIQFAAEKHDGEFRDGDFGLPYATHPIEVCTMLRYIGGITDEQLLCVAVLHDLLEETEVDAATIETLFGLRTKDLVVELTRKEPTAEQVKGLSKDEIWRLRAGMLLAEISKMSADAQAVKLADRLSNIREAKRTKTGEKLKRYVRQTKKILEIIPKTVNPSLWKAIEVEIS